MEDIGLTVNRLLRVSYGPFRLGDLKPGEVEEVIDEPVHPPRLGRELVREASQSRRVVSSNDGSR